MGKCINYLKSGWEPIAQINIDEEEDQEQNAGEASNAQKTDEKTGLYALFLIAYILYIDLRYIRTLDDMLATILIARIYHFVHCLRHSHSEFIARFYELSIFRYFKVAFMIGLASPMSTMLMAAEITLLYIFD